MGAPQEPDRKPFLVRLPKDLEQLLRAEANRNSGSINSEIVRACREHLEALAVVRAARTQGRA